MAPKTFALDTRVTNEGGAWVELKFDPQGGYVPGLGPAGVYYLLHWSPCFKEGVGPAEGVSNRDRAKVERAARGWLANRPLTAEQVAEFERPHG